MEMGNPHLPVDFCTNNKKENKMPEETIFERFRKDLWGKLLTITGACILDPKQREDVKSLMRQAIQQSLDKFEAELRGEPEKGD